MDKWGFEKIAFDLDRILTVKWYPKLINYYNLDNKQKRELKNKLENVLPRIIPLVDDPIIISMRPPYLKKVTYKWVNKLKKLSDVHFYSLDVIMPNKNIGLFDLDIQYLIDTLNKNNIDIFYTSPSFLRKTLKESEYWGYGKHKAVIKSLQDALIEGNAKIYNKKGDNTWTRLDSIMYF